MLLEKAEELLGKGPIYIARAPGRVNLIGDHTDYNGGYVMPMAIDREVRIAFQPLDGHRVELTSLDYDEQAAFDLSGISRGDGPAWLMYPKGVAAILQAEGHTLRGMRGVIEGTVPIGAGLSSSAALEVASAMALCRTSDLKINREKLARICQRAENEFVGMRCGIMDQFASLLCRRGRVLLLDCTTLSHELLPLDENEARIVVCDTRVKRELVGSPYNKRREECAKAFKLLQRHLPGLVTYRDVGLGAFQTFADSLPELLRKRARHVVTENARVLHAGQALRKGDLITFGTLMDASHESLRRDFDVSCDELDEMTGIARDIHGAFGARMTGAGFGGCTVNLVSASAVDEFVKVVLTRYEDSTGRKPGVYVCRPSEGATVEEGRAS